MSDRSISEPPTRRLLLTTLLASSAGASCVALAQSRAGPGQPIIDVDARLTTLINVFSVEPADRGRLVDLLKQGTDGWISKVPGFVSSALHASRDGRRVVIYGQWRNAEGIAAMRQRPEMPAYFEQIKALAHMEAITCDVESTVVA